MPPPANFLVEHRKLVRYLLALDHPDGRAKARFFYARGFTIDGADALARALVEHPRAIDTLLAKVDFDAYASRFVYEGPLPCPDGSHPHLRSVWELKSGESHARLITAYPCAAPAL